MTPPRQYEVQPRRILWLVAGGAALAGLVAVSLVLFTPLRRVVMGPGMAELRSVASHNARRAADLQDSLAVQHRQLTQLRALITGAVDSTVYEEAPEQPVLPEEEEAAAELGVAPDTTPRPAPGARPAAAPRPAGRTAPPLPWLPAGGTATGAAAAAYLSGLRLPALPPVEGIVSRGYNATAGHFGLDIAARVGTPVRAVGDGFVVFADWTHAGGFTIAVQHADGYLSLYAHNQRLLKRVGDRVRTREAIAVSGNTGALTSGPHLHFELWRDGLAQDPRASLALP